MMPAFDQDKFEHWVRLNTVRQLAEWLAEDGDDAVTDVLGTLNFYIGQAARTAVSSESVARYRRLVAARDAVAAALPGTEAP